MLGFQLLLAWYDHYFINQSILPMGYYLPWHSNALRVKLRPLQVIWRVSSTFHGCFKMVGLSSAAKSYCLLAYAAYAYNKWTTIFTIPTAEIKWISGLWRHIIISGIILNAVCLWPANNRILDSTWNLAGALKQVLPQSFDWWNCHMPLLLMSLLQQ